MKKTPTETAVRRKALKDHILEKTALARSRYDDPGDHDTLLRLLEDREIVRYPTTIVFDSEPLEVGEFAYARQRGEDPSEGFRLHVHPHYRERRDVLPLLIAYHLVRVNYGEIATHEEAELFGASLLAMDVEEYYETLCRLADELLSAESVRNSGEPQG